MKLKKVLFAVLTFAFVLLTFSGFKSIAAEKTATYTVTSTSAVTTTTAPDGTSATYSSTYSSKCQLISGNSMTLTLSGYDGYKVIGLTLSMKSNKSSGAGSLSVVAGTTTIAAISDSKFNTSNWNGAWSTEYVNITPDFTSYVVGTGEIITITIVATENSLYCQSFAITYDEATLSDHVTTSSTKSSLRVDYDKEVSAVTKDRYTLVTDVTSITDNDQIIIVAKDYDYALSTDTTQNYGVQTEITKDSNDIYLSSADAVMVLTVSTITEESATSYYFNSSAGYMYAKGGTSSNQLGFKSSNSDVLTKWTVSITDGSVNMYAVYTSGDTSTNKYLRYRNSETRFTTYKTEGQYDDVAIYEYAETVEQNETSYTFTTVKIRFGGVITSDLYIALVAESATFGIELSTNSDFSSSKTYTMTPAVNGDNYQWAAVVTTPADKYATTIYARAYVVISDTTYYMNATNYSVNSIAQYYVDNAATLGLTDTGMLSALMEG